MKNSLNLLMACLMVGGAAFAQSSPQHGIFDIRFLASETPRVSFDLGLPLMSCYSAERGARSQGAMNDGVIDLEDVVQLVRTCVAPESWEEEGVGIETHLGSLLVTQDQAVLADVDRLLAFLQDAIAPSITVEVWKVPAAEAPGAGVLSAQDASALVGRESVKAVGRIHMRSGRPSRLHAGDRVAFLGDYDVEVASEAQVADPVVLVLETGLDLRIGAWRTAGQGVILRVAGSDSTLDALAQRETSSTWVGQVQLPVVDSQVLLGSGAVESGGGLLVGAAQGEDEHVLLIRPEVASVKGVAPGGVCELVPVGACAAGFSGRRALSFGTPMPSYSDGSEGADVFEEVHLEDQDQVVEMIRNFIDPAGWDEDPDRSIWPIAGSLVIRAPEQVRQRARQLIQMMEEARVVNVGLEFRVGVLDDVQSRAAMRGEADLASVAGVLDTKICVGALSGTPFRQSIGRESAFIKDHDVEIAEDATIADPVVSTLFSGVAFEGTVSVPGPGKVALRGEFVVQDLVGDVVPIDGNTNDIGVVEVPRTAGMRAEVAQILEDGRWTLLRLAPRPEREGSLAILVRARL